MSVWTYLAIALITMEAEAQKARKQMDELHACLKEAMEWCKPCNYEHEPWLRWAKALDSHKPNSAMRIDEVRAGRKGGGGMNASPTIYDEDVRLQTTTTATPAECECVNLCSDGGNQMKDAITRAQAASAKAKRQRDNWKRRAEEAEAELASARSAAESAEAWSAWSAAWEAAWSAAEAEAADRSEQLADVVLAIKRKIEGGTSE